MTWNSEGILSCGRELALLNLLNDNDVGNTNHNTHTKSFSLHPITKCILIDSFVTCVGQVCKFSWWTLYIRVQHIKPNLNV
jgi:hypothetical protein